MATLIKFLPEIATFLMTAILAFMLHNGAMNGLKLQHADDIKAQIKADQLVCSANVKIAEDTANERAKNVSYLKSKLAAALRVRVTQCAPVYRSMPIASPVAGPDAASGAGCIRPDGGITAEALLEYGAARRQDQIDKAYCRNFLDGIYKANGQ